MERTGREIAEARRLERIEKIREQLREFLGNGDQRNSLEIGCGHGHWLNSFAEVAPEQKWVGVDLISRRIRLAEEKRAKRGLMNLLFLKAEAQETLEAWPEEIGLQQIFLLHPDPWPKKRHAKNRMTGPVFLDKMAAAMEKGGVLFFRTDDAPFFEWSRDSIDAHPAWERIDLPWPHEAESYFKNLLGVHGMCTAVKK